MSSRRRNKKAVELSPHGLNCKLCLNRQFHTALHKGGNTQISLTSWTISPGGDGVSVNIAASGKIHIRQQPDFTAEQIIILTVDEAVRLKLILISAIRVATRKAVR